MHWGSTEGTNNKRPEDETKSTWGKVLDTGHHLQPIATNLLMARGRLRPIDYVALSTNMIQASLNIYRVWVKQEAKNLSTYFDHNGSSWKLAAWLPCKYALEGMDIPERIVETHKEIKGGKVVNAAWTATIDGIEIGWVSGPGQSTLPAYVWSKTPDKIRDIAARRLWEKAGSDKMLRVDGHDVLPVNLATNIVETQFLKRLQARVTAFLDKRVSRAMVLDGEPGTGKTTAVGYVSKKMGFRTVVMPATDFIGTRSGGGRGERYSGIHFVEMLKPDVLIINDVDRVARDAQLALLDVFDNAKLYTKLVFATTNHYRDLIEPARRPGRLDDLLKVPGLTREELMHIAPLLGDYHERMLDWPIAYVRDVMERHYVLGEEGLKEFPEVAKRLQEVRADGGYNIEGERPDISHDRWARAIAKNLGMLAEQNNKKNRQDPNVGSITIDAPQEA